MVIYYIVNHSNPDFLLPQKHQNAKSHKILYNIPADSISNIAYIKINQISKPVIG